MKVRFLIGSPIRRGRFNDKLFIPKWKLFGKIAEGENCFNKVIGYKDTLRWISICLLFIGVKIYY